MGFFFHRRGTIVQQDYCRSVSRDKDKETMIIFMAFRSSNSRTLICRRLNIVKGLEDITTICIILIQPLVWLVYTFFNC